MGNDDYSIYPHLEEVIDGYHWRIGIYDGRGVLSVEEIDLLEERWDLPRTVLERCSVELGHCLEPDAAINFVEVRKSVATPRGERTLEDVRHQAREAARKLSGLSKQVRLLSSYFDGEAENERALSELKLLFEAAVTANTDLGKAATDLLGRKGAAAEMSPRDRRKVRDMRRPNIVATCCYAWQDAGRTVSYTTRSDRLSHEALGGQLVEFINHIILMLTDPRKEIARGTLKKDIDRFRRKQNKQNKEDELLMPPDFGNQEP